MLIRHATPDDYAAISEIILPVFRNGETYTIDPKISESDAIAYWTGNDKKTFVAEVEGDILGTYYLRPNQAGGGSHICNCGYMTHANATRRGVASVMCAHSLEYAKSIGFRGMQYNFVVGTNVGAIRLWQKFGFETVGRLPKSFKHPSAGYVDAFVLFRAL
ncbi:MAG: GNAT family N-acetyltransferase [Pseudomonadota bacterium]